MMKPLLLLILLSSLSIAGYSQVVAKKDYKLRVAKRELSVVHKGKIHSLKPAGEYIDAARITSAKILFVSRANGYRYFLIDVTGWSKGKGDNRQCGAGIESNLIYVRVSPRWLVTMADGVRYESCWSSVDSDEGYRIKNGVLELEYDNFREDENVKLRYDANDPESFFKIDRKKIE